MNFNETTITREIIESYQAKLLDRIESDVIIAGAGPSGLVAGYYASKAGLKVTVMEKRLSTGGGIWGGGMAMNEVVIHQDAAAVAREFGVRLRKSSSEGLFNLDAVELASALTLKAIQAGVAVFNLVCVEDVCVRDQKVTGLVVNQTTILDKLPVDPLMFKARAVLDATGHEAAVLQALRKHGYKIFSTTGELVGEGAMDPSAGESFVVERTSEVYRGLFVSGMAVCAAFGGPRMGPIFGGMLLSGQKAASLMIKDIKGSKTKEE